MTFFFDENKKCCPKEKPTPPVECCIDLPLDGNDVVYRGVTLKILDVKDGEDHDSILRKIDEIINNLNTSSGGNYFFKNIGDGEVLFKALTNEGEVLFKTIKSDGTINIEAGEDTITLSAGEQYLRYVPVEDTEDVEEDPYGKEKYAMRTIGVMAQAGLLYDYEVFRKLVENSNNVPFENFDLIEEYYDNDIGETVYADDGYYFILKKSDEGLFYEQKNLSEQSSFSLVRDSLASVLLREDFITDFIPASYIDEIYSFEENNIEETCDSFFKIAELLLLLTSFSDEELLYESEYKPYMEYLYLRNYDGLSEIESHEQSGLPRSITEMDSVFLKYYNNQDIPFMHRIYMCFAIVLGSEIGITKMYYDEESYMTVGENVINGIMYSFTEESFLNTLADEDLQGIVIEELEPNTTQGFLDICYIFSLFYKKMIQEVTESGSFESVLSEIFPENRYNYIAPPDGDYLENIVGNSIRYKEGYKITDNKDLITKEYYHKNMPDIPEGNLIIATTYDDYWNYIDYSPDAKEGQIVYNTEEKKYYTIVDNGNGYLEYKQFSPSLEHDVFTDVEVGGIPAGIYLHQGMTFTEFVTSLMQKIFNPTYIEPTFSVSNNAGIREVGETFNITITASYNRGSINGKLVNNVWEENTIQNYRAGNATAYEIDGTTVQGASRVISTTASNTAKSFTAIVRYGNGSVPVNSKGNYLYDQVLPAGVLTATTSYTGYYRRFSGGVSTLPTNGTTLRTALLSSSVINTTNSFTISTGTTNKIFIIALPPGKTLSRVVNQNTNQDLTTDFVLSTSITSVPNAGGQNVSGYKVYIMTNDVPFTANQTLNVTLT